MFPWWTRSMKSGVRGVAYVRTGSTAAWPEALAVKLPQ